MKFFRLAAAAALATAPAGLPLAAQTSFDDTTARPIALDEAVRLARRNSPLAIQARGQIRQSRASVRSAYAAFLPNMQVGVTNARTEGSGFDPVRNQVVQLTSWQYSSQFFASMNLFDGGQRFFELRRSRADVEAAEASDVAQRYTVSLNVKQQYYNVLAARESEAAARAQLQQAEQQLRASSARVAAGAATRSDSLRSVIQVGNARLALVTAQNSLRAANASLTRLVATPFTVTAVLDGTSEPAIVTLDSAELLQLAANGPLIEQARYQQRAARAAVRAAGTPYLPSLSASFSRNGNTSDPNFHWVGPDYNYSNRLSFSLGYPLFNQWQREANRTRAIVAEDVAEANLRDAQLAARQTLVQQVGALRNAEERIAIQQASVEAAEEDLRVQQQRYALGASTLLDVLTSQTQLNQAQSSLIQARLDFRVARAQLEALIGRDLE